jgi:hypothetical protein
VKKKKKNNNKSNQIQISFGETSSNKMAVESNEVTSSKAKVLPVDFRSHIYKSILNRKML